MPFVLPLGPLSFAAEYERMRLSIACQGTFLEGTLPYELQWVIRGWKLKITKEKDEAFRASIYRYYARLFLDPGPIIRHLITYFPDPSFFAEAAW